MKKTNLILLFILLFALTASTCKKKRYPKDIPKWLKEKIEVMEKDSKVKGCAYDICRTVEEHTDGFGTYYWINSSGATPVAYTVFSYDGLEMCFFVEINSSDPCAIKYKGMEFIRLVWHEN